MQGCVAHNAPYYYLWRDVSDPNGEAPNPNRGSPHRRAIPRPAPARIPRCTTSSPLATNASTWLCVCGRRRRLDTCHNAFTAGSPGASDRGVDGMRTCGRALYGGGLALDDGAFGNAFFRACGMCTPAGIHGAYTPPMWSLLRRPRQPQIGGVGGAAEGFATDIATSDGDGTAMLPDVDLDLDLTILGHRRCTAALNSLDKTFAPALLLASATSAADVPQAHAPAPGCAARITRPAIGIHSATALENGCSAALSRVDARTDTAMPPTRTATPLAACIAWISRCIRSPRPMSSTYCSRVRAIRRANPSSTALAARSSSDACSIREDMEKNGNRP